MNITNNVRLLFVFSSVMASSCIFLSSCSSNQSSSNLANPKNDVSNSAPIWFSDPYDGSICNKVQHICQAAMGRNASQADAMAKAELAAYFGTQISSQNYHATTSKEETEHTSSGKLDGQDVQTQSYQGSVGTEDRSSLSVDINALLQVTEIVARNKNGVDHYALAQMNKRKAQQIVEGKIEKSQMSIKKLDKYQSRSALPLIRTEYVKLLDQATMLKLLDGDDRTKEFEAEFNQRLTALEKFPAKKIQINGTTTINEELNDLVVDALSQQVSEMGHEISEDENVANMNGRIALKILEVKSHSKIAGFEKWRIRILATYQEKSSQKGRLTLEKEFSGRSKTHIYDQIRPWLDSQLAQQIYLLNL